MSKINQIVCYFGIGAGSDASRRFMQFVQPSTGWAGFVTNHIRPMIDRGVRRFLLWMPFGREATTRTQLMGSRWVATRLRYDAYDVARKNPANDWFTKGFVEAIYPITRSGVEVIAYLGTLHGAPEFESLSPSQAKWEAIMAIAPLIDARCSIALDTAINSYPGHLVYDLVQLLKVAGIKGYIEPTPHVTGQHWFNTSCVVSDAQWAAVSRPGNQHILAAPSLLKGEIIRGWFGAKPTLYPTHREWFNWTVPHAMMQGHTCCLPLTDYVRVGGKVSDLVR